MPCLTTSPLSLVMGQPEPVTPPVSGASSTSSLGEAVWNTNSNLSSYSSNLHFHKMSRRFLCTLKTEKHSLDIRGARGDVLYFSWIVFWFVRECSLWTALCSYTYLRTCSHPQNHQLISKTHQTLMWKLRSPLTLWRKGTMCEAAILVLVTVRQWKKHKVEDLSLNRSYVSH